MNRYLLVCGIAAATFVPGFAVRTARATLVAAGPQIRLEADRAVHDLCGLSSGEFVVAHHIHGQSSQFFAQRYTPRGERAGAAITTATMIGTDPRVACDPNGGFAVVWKHADGITVQRFDNAGNAAGAQILVQEATSATEWSPDVSIASDSSFVVVWNHIVGDGTFARTYDAAGVPAGPAFAFGDHSTSSFQRKLDLEHGPDDVARVLGRGCYLPNGDIVHVTMFYSNADSIRASVVTPGGTTLLEFVTLVEGQGGLADADVACLADGTIFLVWDTTGSYDGHGNGLRARRFDSSLAPAGDEFAVNRTRVMGQTGPTALATAAGEVFVVWSSSLTTQRYPNLPGEHLESYAQRYCDDSSPQCAYACPGFDDGVDVDADGVPAGCDGCDEVGGAISAMKVSARTNIASFDSDGFNSLVARGTLQLPPGVDLAAVAPNASPLRVRISSVEGDVIDVTLGTAAFAGKGTAGWTVNGAGGTWKYTDKRACGGLGADGAIRGMRLKDASSEGPGLVKFSVKGRGRRCSDRFFAYPTTARDQALDVSLALADSGCGEVGFEAAECSFGAFPFNQTTCKR